MLASAIQPDRIVQATTGRSFQLLATPASDWKGEWPTDRTGDVLVTESPGNCNGSIFVYWIGADKTLEDPDVMESIKAHLDDHDVVGVRVVHDFPEQVHSSLRGDLVELQQRAQAASGQLQIREGVRVRVKRNQQRIGGDIFPGREGIVQSLHDGLSEYAYVLLEATNRAKARRELFSTKNLEVLTTANEISSLPPMTAKQIAEQLDSCGSIVFAGASYVLLEHQVDGLRDGWAVNASYSNGSKRMFGERHPLTRLLALQLAADDAIDWYLNRRESASK